MRIALLGYGKMGKAIEKIALQRGHEIVAKVNSSNPIENVDFSNVDVAIEFSLPTLVLKHIDYCLGKNTPIVVGTTAWNEHLDRITTEVNQKQGALLHASNFSIGVNLFFEMNRKLAKLMSNYSDYKAEIEEIHHLQKLDAPSGTAITIAQDIMFENSNYDAWTLGEETKPSTTSTQLPVTSYRKPDVPGTHIVSYTSPIDTITLSHEAHNREGFALGSVIGAEFIHNKTGVFTMSDVLKN